MASSATCDSECVCAICTALLTENPEEDQDDDLVYLGPPPPPAKRPRAAPGVGSNGPRPSTSSQRYSTGGGGVREMPALLAPPCGHICHKYCLLDWIKRKRVCPTCREKVDPVDLIRIYLPLTPGGQCRQCKECVKEVEVCKEDARNWRQRWVELTVENENLREELIVKGEEMKELEKEARADKLYGKLKTECMETGFRRRITSLEVDVEAKRISLLEKEESEEDLLERCEGLEKDKKLALLEKEKFRKGMAFQKSRVDYLVEWCEQNWKGDRRQLGLLKQAIQFDNVNLSAAAEDLEGDLEDSSESPEEEAGPSYPLGGGSKQLQRERRLSSATVTIADSDSDSEDASVKQAENDASSVDSSDDYEWMF